MLLDFNARGRLIRPMSLSIRFLFVRLRFRYCFFSPIPHDMNLASRFRVRRKLRPLWTFTTDERHARHTAKSPARSKRRGFLRHRQLRLDGHKFDRQRDLGQVSVLIRAMGRRTLHIDVAEETMRRHPMLLCIGE